MDERSSKTYQSVDNMFGLINYNIVDINADDTFVMQYVKDIIKFTNSDQNVFMELHKKVHSIIKAYADSNKSPLADMQFKSQLKLAITDL